MLVGAGVAEEAVRQTVAGGVDAGAPGQGQVLEVGDEREGHGAVHRVRALVGVLDRPVARVVDPVEVVPRLALQPVGARAAVERVVAGAAEQGVVAGQPPQVVVPLEPLDPLGRRRAGHRLARRWCP